MAQDTLPTDTNPPLPRRVFLAAGLAAVTAAAATGLAVWGNLGAPETETFQFSRGASFANGEEDRLRGALTLALNDDRYAVVISGHSGTEGDAQANLELSETRAEAARAIALDLGIDPGRVTAAALGGGAPLAQEQGESDRAYQSRLARVDVTFQVRR